MSGAIHQGLSSRTIEALASQYADMCYADYHASGSSDAVDYRKLDVWLREQLSAMGVFREHIASAFDRVMDLVFAAR